MDNNKDIEVKENAMTVEFEAIPEPAAETAAAKTEKKKSSWANKPVTGKVLVIALCIAVLVNAAITAAITGGIAKSISKNLPQSGRPGSNMMDGYPGGMTPPGKSSGNSNSNGAPQGMPEQQGQGQDQDQSQSSGPSIGIMIKEDSGVIIAQVTGDKAKAAGFKEGDKVIKIEDKTVSTGNDLVSEVKSHQAGDTVTVTVERDGQQMEIKTELE